MSTFPSFWGRLQAERVRAFVAARGWTVATTLALLIFLMSLWIITPSSLMFRPVSWEYSPATGTAKFTRVLNVSPECSDPHATGPMNCGMFVRWAHIVYIPDGPSCTSSGVKVYDGRVQSEEIEATDLRRCLDNPENVAVLSWSPLLFGMIPMRPFTMTVPAGADIPRAR